MIRENTDLTSHIGFSLLMFLIPVLGLGGCAVGPDFQNIEAPSVQAYTSDSLTSTNSASKGVGGGAQFFVRGMDLPGEWWRLFHSNQINAFVEEAIRNHPDAAAAQYALRAAHEQVLAEEGALLPTISLASSTARDLVSAESGGTTGDPSLYTLHSPSVTVAFSPDLFGGTRREIESLAAQADYQRFQLEATYLTLTANVVNAAINEASLRAQISATDDVIKIETEQLDRVHKQLQLGGISLADVLSQEAALAQTKATLPPLRKQQLQQRNALMAYLGRLPSEDRGESLELANLHLPAHLPVSLPSSLVRQRPDIRAAEANVHQASAKIGVDIANMLPDISLSATGSSNALSLKTLWSSQGWSYSLASNLTQKLFDAGTLYHTKEADVADYQQYFAKYQSTVLSAFQNVSDSLRAIQTDADALKAQLNAEKISRDSLALSKSQYKIGAVTYPTVLNAEQTYQTALISRLKAQAARFGDTVALYQALGGGWWHRADETQQSSPRKDPGYFAGPM